MKENSVHPCAREAADSDTDPQRLSELSRDSTLLPLIAANPATPSGVLDVLSRGQDRALRRSVAQNPNTPLSALLQLAQEFPQEFLANPILPLLNLAQPDFMKDAPPVLWFYLLHYENIPPMWLQGVQADTIPLQRGMISLNIKTWIKSHVAFAGEATEDWEQEASSALEEYTASVHGSASQIEYLRHAKIFVPFLLLFPQSVFSWINDFPASYNFLKEMFLLYSTDISVVSLIEFTKQKDIVLLCRMLRHARVPQQVLSSFINHAASEVRHAIAQNPRVSPALLHILAGDKEFFVRRTVARHYLTELTDLEKLARDADELVRSAVAGHPQLTSAFYQLLLADAKPLVRVAIAKNVHAPGDVLVALASDADTQVRSAVARNPRLPTRAFAGLCEDAAAEVRSSLATNTQLPALLFERLAMDRAWQVRKSVAANLRIPQYWLDMLLAEKNMEIWTGIARNPRTPSEILARIAQEGDESGRIAVAANKRAPVEILSKLAERAEWILDAKLVRNYSTPLPALKQILWRYPQVPQLWVEITHHPAVIRDQRRILQDFLIENLKKEVEIYGPSQLHLALLEYEDLSLPFLKIYANSVHWAERYLCACNPKTSQKVLMILLHDGNRYVRAAVRAALGKKS